MNLSKLYVGIAGAALSLALFGCSGQVSVTPLDNGPVVVTPPVLTDGTLTVTWTIGGSAAPLECVTYNIDRLELAIFDITGAPVTTTAGPCETFGLTVDLPPGTYTADATLVDATSRTASDTLPLDNIVIVRGTNLSIDVDFPVGSIH